MSYLIHDAETTIYTSYKRKANPFDERNFVVANGFKRPTGKVFTHYYGTDATAAHVPILPEDKLLVGFNYKFDMLHHWRRSGLRDFLKRGGKIWCCQYAEYLLDGQVPTSQMCSLDECAVKYGGTTKIDEVKAMWKEGIQTYDIPEDLLLEYLEGDILNTEIVFLAQVKRAREQGQLNDIMGRMEGLLATTEMEYNGLHVNTEQAAKDQAVLEEELAVLAKTLDAALPELPPELKFNWGSGTHKSCLLFGGTVKYSKWTPYLDENGKQLYAQMDILSALKLDGATIPLHLILDKFGPVETWTTDVKNALQFYKGGKKQGELKTKNIKVDNPDKPKGAQKDYLFTFDRITEPEQEWLGKLTDAYDKPIYSTSGDVIEALGTRDIKFLKALANRVKISKDLSTYYLTEDSNGTKTGMLTCVMPDGRIHHKLNHTLTVTTRLSSSDPNLQNVPRPDFDVALGRPKSLVKQMFSSRFGTEGRMVEIDYKQLEVVIQGFLSNDPALIKDIQAGVDFHCKRLAAKLGEEYEYVKAICSNEDHPKYAEYKRMRTSVKEFTFQMAYGAGAKSIAAGTGMPLEEVEALFKSEETLYPGITKFHDSVQEEIERTRYATNISEELPDKPGVYVQCGRGYYKTPTQARFVFTEVPCAAWQRKRTGRDASFYRPHIQNYPGQGVGGQVVQYVLGKLFRKLVLTSDPRDWVMCNTVHDCVWYDFRTEQLALETIPKIIRVMQSIPDIIQEYFSIECTVPFPVETEIGKDMLNLHGLH